MFGSIGSLELLFIMVIALVVVGPKKLPQIARTMGKMFGEFKKVSNDVKQTIDLEVQKIEKQEAQARAKSELLIDDVATTIMPETESEKSTDNTEKQPASNDPYKLAQVPDSTDSDNTDKKSEAENTHKPDNT